MCQGYGHGVLAPGGPAPDIAATDQLGEPFALHASLASTGARHLVFFYPRASTPGCTQQACGLRDVLDRSLGTVVVGVSPDRPPALRRFHDQHRLGFTLVSDPDHVAADAYGVWQQKTMYGRTSMGIVRSAFLVSPDGRIDEAWYRISPKDTPVRLLTALGVTS